MRLTEYLQELAEKEATIRKAQSAVWMLCSDRKKMAMEFKIDGLNETQSYEVMRTGIIKDCITIFYNKNQYDNVIDIEDIQNIQNKKIVACFMSDYRDDTTGELLNETNVYSQINRLSKLSEFQRIILQVI